MSPRTGRPKSDNAKRHRLEIRLNEDEFALINDCAKQLSTTKTNVIIKGVKLLKSKLQ